MQLTLWMLLLRHVVSPRHTASTAPDALLLLLGLLARIPRRYLQSITTLLWNITRILVLI